MKVIGFIHIYASLFLYLCSFASHAVYKCQKCGILVTEQEHHICSNEGNVKGQSFYSEQPHKYSPTEAPGLGVHGYGAQPQYFPMMFPAGNNPSCGPSLMPMMAGAFPVSQQPSLTLVPAGIQPGYSKHPAQTISSILTQFEQHAEFYRLKEQLKQQVVQRLKQFAGQHEEDQVKVIPFEWRHKRIASEGQRILSFVSFSSASLSEHGITLILADQLYAQLTRRNGMITVVIADPNPNKYYLTVQLYGATDSRYFYLVMGDETVLKIHKNMLSPVLGQITHFGHLWLYSSEYEIPHSENSVDGSDDN